MSVEPEPETDVSPPPVEPAVDFHGEEWTKYEEDDTQDMYEDAEAEVPEDETPEEEAADEIAARVDEEQVEKQKIEELALADDKVQTRLSGSPIKKVIVVPDKLVNIVH